jgi:alkylation response protein AidB-like acyl-CoA dehydrogenase
MRFALTPEQRLSRDALRALLREHCTPAHVRAVFESDATTRIPGLWSQLTQLGVVGALAPESLGGAGLDAIDLSVLLEETGRFAVPERVVETAAVAVPLLAACAEDSRAARLLARVLAGQATVAVAFHGRTCVGDESAAGVLVEEAGAIHLMEADALRSGARSVDRTRRALVVASQPRSSPLQGSTDQQKPGRAAGTRAASDALGPETLLACGPRAQRLMAAAFDHAALGTAAQLVGLGARMLELTLAHVQTREQFGRPIGSFQAVKHQLVDAHVAVEYARPLVYRAAHSIAREDPERTIHVSMAKAFASDAALLAARKSLQLHGAIGYSYEYDLHLFMKRSWALAAAYGDALEHRKRIADVAFATEGESHV